MCVYVCVCVRGGVCVCVYVASEWRDILIHIQEMAGVGNRSGREERGLCVRVCLYVCVFVCVS
jgi:hypothetical protein